MRTLKRTLCLALVLVMMVGLLAVGASAVSYKDYPDKDQITHPEAVALLSAMKVLEGDERGFRATDTLTRAEASAFVTRLMASNGAGVSSFTDMGSFAWAQPYVAYCEVNGILAGNGDGTFGPSNPLTAVAWAKMLLCALGYSSEMEGLVGPQWEINTIKLVNKIDLANGIGDIDWNAPITRDDAAQMAFNCLQSDMVEYNGNVKVTTGDGTKVEVGANAIKIGNTAYDYTGIIDKVMQFIEMYFPTVKVSSHKNQDDFGVYTSYWFRGENRTDDTWTTAKALADAPVGRIIKTYTAGLERVSSNTIYNDAAFTETTEIGIIENGAKAYPMSISKGGTAPLFADYSGATATLTKLATGIYVMYIKYPYLAEVTAVTPAAESLTKERTISLKAYKGPAATDTFAPTFETEGFAKKDFVLAYPKGRLSETKTDTTEILAVELAEVATGIANAYSGTTANLKGVTVDGVKYDYAALGFLGKTTGLKLNTEVTTYLSNGYIMGLKATPAATAADFVYALGQTDKSKDAFGRWSAEVGYLKQDATTATAALYDAEHVTVTAGWKTMAQKGTAYEFNGPTGSAVKGFFADHEALKNELTGGKYVWSLKPSQFQFTEHFAANNNTVFVIKSGIGTYATYTGIKNVPTFSGKADTLAKVPVAQILLSNGTPAAVYIDMTGSFAQDTAVAPILVLSTDPVSTREANGITYYTYSVIKDGAVTTVEAPSTVTGIAKGLIVPAFDANGVISRIDPATSTIKANNLLQYTDAEEEYRDIKFSGGILTYDDGGDEQVMLADDVEFCVYNAKVNPFGLISGADVDYIAAKDGYLSLVQVSGTNTAIKTVYFVVA